MEDVMKSEIEYIVSFTSEYPNVVIPQSINASFDGPLHRSLMTIWDGDEKSAACMEHVLQNQSNVAWFKRVVRVMETDLPENFTERYSNKRDAMRQARKVGADVVIQESETRRGNVYFLVPWAA